MAKFISVRDQMIEEERNKIKEEVRAELKQERQIERERFLFMDNIEILRNVVSSREKEVELFDNVIKELQERMKLCFADDEPAFYISQSGFGHFFCQGHCFLGYSFALLDAEKAEDREYALSLAINKAAVNNDKIESFKKYPYLLEATYYYFKIGSIIYAYDEREELLSDYCAEILEAILSEEFKK